MYTQSSNTFQQPILIKIKRTSKGRSKCCRYYNQVFFSYFFRILTPHGLFSNNFDWKRCVPWWNSFKRKSRKIINIGSADVISSRKSTTENPVVFDKGIRVARLPAQHPKMVALYVSSTAWCYQFFSPSSKKRGKRSYSVRSTSLEMLMIWSLGERSTYLFSATVVEHTQVGRRPAAKTS